MTTAGYRTLERAVRVPVVLRYLGELGLVLGLSMLVPTAGGLVFGEYRLLLPYVVVGGLLVAAGWLARRASAPRDVQRNEAFVVTVGAFVLAPIVMSLPLAFHGTGWGDALFESISGITTTGLSTLNDLDARSHTFLLARAWMQWIGGLGFVVLSLAILFEPGVATRRLATPALDLADVEGSIRVHARRVLVIYLVLTASGVALLLLLGASGFDAVVHTLAGVSTGGFAPRDASLAPLGAGVQYGTLGIALLGAVSLPLYGECMRGRWRRLRDDPEARALIVFIAVGGALLYAATHLLASTPPPPVGDLALLAVSAQTTAGFSTVSVDALPAAAKGVLIFAMVSGGSQGSTAGGLKLLRILALGRLVRWQLVETRLPPHAVSAPSLSGHRLESGELLRAGTLLLLFVVTLAVSWLAFLFYGYPPVEALFEVASATGTVGLSVGITRSELEPFLKGVLCMNMLLGRLEIFAVLVTLAPRTWIGRRTS